MLYKDANIAPVFNASISASSCACAMSFVLAACSTINVNSNSRYTPRTLILRGLESCGWDHYP